MKLDNSLDMLVGETISGICFVMDYVEFHFHGPILRALTAPILRHEGKEIQFPSIGSRDALCALINTEVVEVHHDKTTVIELILKPAFTLIIPLSQEARIGPEAAHFVPAIDKPIQVW